MTCDVVTEETSAYPHADASLLRLRPWQAAYLQDQSVQLSLAGGPQSAGVKDRAEACARRLRAMLEPTQCATIDRYAANRMTLLVVEGMRDLAEDVPDELPARDALRRDPLCLVLASRHQILLHLVGNRAFAYDVDDDDSGMVRIARDGQDPSAHTEPPYDCSFHAADRHSPAPSTLILTARWNPLSEPTRIVPAAPVLRALGEPAIHALTQKHYRFSLSGPRHSAGVSILDFNNHGDYALRFSAARFSACDDAPESAQRAIAALKAGLAAAEPIEVTLDASKAVLINNTKALQCSDSFDGSWRVLVGLLGYNRFSTGLVRSTDPMRVQG